MYWLLSPYFLLIWQSISSKGIYYESMWDPVVANPEYKVKNDILSLQGFYESHNVPSIHVKTYGDLNLLTVNIYRDIIEKHRNITLKQELKAMIDHIHPTIFTIQGVDEEILSELGPMANSHYKIVNNDRSTGDFNSGKRLFLPIIYDSVMLELKDHDYFYTTGETKNIYASFAIFKNLRESSSEITAINLDLVSSYKEVNFAYLSNIINDIIHDPRVNNDIVFLMGGIGAVNKDITELLKKEYENLVDLDKNNINLSHTTVHANLVQDDDIQRDFIILRDKKREMELNYARILKEANFLGDHFPVNAILSFTGQVGNKTTIYGVE
ncbi:hypothetical protein CWI37_0425p0030 [Hamiltosporidium tvaerminnensis]|uniref:Endonuclease/exonuclease/phosphatase domain-containing protein n=2 Tax=Hamiltosporidium TaxID=1176354 RepID=A0A4Q9KZW4_9MICR|nr:hypothetical protein LUQ84_3626 [Hamiltosporidium tvaerminnensis]TBT99893.1 hypothetical protein CWI39_1856p0020 [Hamiltosporidium magnivora]TBU00597.1 hypothetical protein CWI36_1589p0020 [Hamiltosporidium magnivora]TBU02722.1 hypothetical protein CWI37_0425p0030 [Hamiltosporidium tvaerminnensis]